MLYIPLIFTKSNTSGSKHNTNNKKWTERLFQMNTDWSQYHVIEWKTVNKSRGSLALPLKLYSCLTMQMLVKLLISNRVWERIDFAVYFRINWRYLFIYWFDVIVSNGNFQYWRLFLNQNLICIVKGWHREIGGHLRWWSKYLFHLIGIDASQQAAIRCLKINSRLPYRASIQGIKGFQSVSFRNSSR